MKNTLLFIVVTVAIIATPVNNANACGTYQGEHVGTARVVVSRTSRPNYFTLSYKITWNKKARGRNIVLQAIRLHRYIMVKPNKKAKYLHVKGKGASPRHNVMYSNKTSKWISFSILVAPGLHRGLEQRLNKRVDVFHRKGKKGASFGEVFGPDDARPKGMFGCGPAPIKWPSNKRKNKPLPKAKASDF